MTKPDTTEDFTAASPNVDAGSARWARRLPLRFPARLPIPIRRRKPRPTEIEEEGSEAAEADDEQASEKLEPTHRLEGFELRSVASTALLYYGCAFLVLVLGVVLVWFGASMFGVVGRIEEFMRSIGFRDFNFAGFKVITGGILLAVSAVAFLTVMTVIGAAFYNLLGRPHRGVKVRLVAIEPPVLQEPEPTPEDDTGGEAALELVTSNGESAA